jgi:succinyl-CoA synthetase beta subunit
MNIHEYQAKELFKEFGIAIPNGVAVKSENEFDSAIASLNGDYIVETVASMMPYPFVKFKPQED